MLLMAFVEILNDSSPNGGSYYYLVRSYFKPAVLEKGVWYASSILFFIACRPEHNLGPYK